MSFLRHRKIYSDVPISLRWDRQPRPASHRNESSAGYSLASCTPALLAAASPAPLILNQSTLFVDIISANGKPSPFGLYQPRGPLHNAPFPALLSPFVASCLRFAPDPTSSPSPIQSPHLTKPNTFCTIVRPASLRSEGCSPSYRNAVRLPTGIPVQIHRN